MPSAEGCDMRAGVYTATELFMLTDYSPGYADTWQSLDRRLQDVRRLGGAASEVLPCDAPACYACCRANAPLMPPGLTLHGLLKGSLTAAGQAAVQGCAGQCGRHGGLGTGDIGQSAAAPAAAESALIRLQHANVH